jgi:hypothetical protein
VGQRRRRRLRRSRSPSFPGFAPLVTVTLPVPAERPLSLLPLIGSEAGPHVKGDYDTWAPRARADQSRQKTLPGCDDWVGDVGLVAAWLRPAAGQIQQSAQHRSAPRPQLAGRRLVAQTMDAGGGCSRRHRASQWAWATPSPIAMYGSTPTRPHVLTAAGHVLFFLRLKEPHAPTGTVPTCPR